METRRWKFNISACAGFSSSLAALSIQPFVSNEREFVGQRLEIHGMKHNKTTNQHRDKVFRRNILENPVVRHRIPACAVVVFENGRPFKVNVEAKVSASSKTLVDPRSSRICGRIIHLYLITSTEYKILDENLEVKQRQTLQSILLQLYPLQSPIHEIHR